VRAVHRHEGGEDRGRGSGSGGLVPGRDSADGWAVLGCGETGQR
jgi:hypothetical protein